VTKQYREGDIAFKYPEHWIIVDRKGSQVLIGSNAPESNYRPEPGGVPTHGLLFGSYDGNATDLEGAANELLGILHQPFPYLVYQDDQKGSGKSAGRDFFYIGIRQEYEYRALNENLENYAYYAAF
jgi:hypothetical protein